ncbi:hypothetical protein PHYBLDRAFT_150647 [Phycomyces blakesleeanus NRRL 1555(-)]|uniref:Uncharacterized protein n=1 Tax=Phycomyces blakesleeanus (strain ATCC 8743b / DSM 1359 / FGSC 10004 / NBRC 33097 / NRRL 1555) TaxID=763407 RepID=A0A167KN71_PHYB8|nr:hypothetical protein PHYBLDRAFT_150647 [Phycomyces blakesleeanus NRRL 1555(-)]OAD68476.1 hypothetical protein PHYBLDRAFT_150647 [Phycomyces blakesleeanus NRRL 1555(-)]|eukprot:XP_018286516.1 hypothetical protein PHYBLDRAFT_150647 [Phycomyces blakesleeanus NRRL 1555(-)]
MPSIKKTLPHKCGSCKKAYSNMKMAEKFLTQCLKNQLENMRNAHLSAAPLLLMSSHHDSTDGNNNTDLNDPICDIEYENDIESGTSLLVFDFSKPSPIPSKNDAKNLELIKIINDFDISCQAQEKLTAHFNKILELSTEITYRACTPYLGSKLLKRYSDVEENIYSVCPKGCMMFNEAHEIVCKHCGEDRYKADKTNKDDMPVAAKNMVQIALVRQLALVLANGTTSAEMLYHHNHEQNSDGSKSDIFDGHAYQTKKHIFTNENEIAILLSFNGFAFHNISDSITILYATILNLLPMPTLLELKVLQEKGMIVKIQTATNRAKVHVLIVTGNIPAVAKLACHAGHMSKNGCRICNVVAQTPGRGQYFRFLPGTNICTLERFQNFDNTSLSCKGLTGQSAFVSLASFTGPLFFALDKMHGLCHEIGKQIWGLVCGKYGSNHPLFLSVSAQKEIGLFPRWWQSVSMIEMHRRHCLALKLVSWNTYIENLYVKDLVELPVFTINQHLLQYYPEMVDAYGPPRAYSARSLERVIGEYSRSIKSNSAISVNAGNIMVRLAWTRRIDLKDSGEDVNRAIVLEYDDVSAGWPMTEEGEHVGAKLDIEF